MKRIRKITGKNASGVEYIVTVEVKAPPGYPRKETINLADIAAGQFMMALAGFSGTRLAKIKVKG